MKRLLIIAGVILAVLFLSVGLVWLRLRAGRPDALIARLATSRGAERQDILLRLSLARGEVMATLIEAFGRGRDPAFRAELLDLLLKRNLRDPDEQALALVRKALKDEAPEVRRAAAYGLVLYGDKKGQQALAASVTDPDPQVRRQVYALFAGCDSHANRRGVYGELSEEAHQALLAACAAQMKTEADPDAAYLARAVVGLEISIRCEDAMQAVVTADIKKARELMESALVLDPESKQAQTRLARLYLATGDPNTAVATALQYGALIEIPRLSKAPVIDGDPTDETWRDGFTTDTFYNNTSGYVAKRAVGKSRCFIGHRDGRIYVAMLAFEDDLDKLVVSKKKRDDEVFRDDCFELIFNPENSEKDFIKFDVNPLGTLADGKSPDFKGNFNCECKAGIFRDRGYWAAEFAIDAKELTPRPITSDTIWALDFFRTRIGAASEQGGIWPTYGFSLRAGLYPLAVFKDAPYQIGR